MSDLRSSDVVQQVRAWAETGALGPLMGRYREDAELEALIPGRRVHCEGVAAIGAELGSWWSGPAHVMEVTIDPTPEGTVSVDIERHPLDRAVPSRLSHVLRLDHGEIVRHLVMCSRPRHVIQPGLAMPLADVPGTPDTLGKRRLGHHHREGRDRARPVRRQTLFSESRLAHAGHSRHRP
jgi:hypothetical protein